MTPPSPVTVPEVPYILQYGSLAGWPHLVARGLRAAGYSSLNVVAETGDVEDLDRQLPHDRALNRKHQGKLHKFLSRSAYMVQASREASLVHYHGAVIQRGSWHHLFEGPLYARHDIPMIMSFGGGDARIISDARAKNPYFYRKRDDARDQRTRAYLKSISRYIRHAASDPEMLSYARDYFDECHLFRQPVDLTLIPFNEPNIECRPVVLHIPTEPWVKGTDLICEAAAKLQSEGHDFEFRMKRQLTQREFFREIANCDIYVDELKCGAHGVTAVETMAAGKPTLTYIRDDLVAEFPPELPLVNTNPDTIYERLRELIVDADMRRRISFASRSYVERYHALDVVVRDLVAIYKKAGWQA